MSIQRPVSDLHDVLREQSLLQLLAEDMSGADGVQLPQHGATLDFDTYLQAIIQIHFDDEYGTPYWQEAAESLPFDPCSAIQSIDDLEKLPAADEAALKHRPVSDFMPQLYSPDRVDISKSSGTAGPKKTMPWLRTVSEEMARWYEWNLRQRGIEDGNWLVVGPYGLYEKHLEMAANQLNGFCHFTAIEPKGIKRQVKAAGLIAERPWRVFNLRMGFQAIQGLIRTRIIRQAIVDDIRSQPIEHIASAAPLVKQFHDVLSSPDAVSSPEDIETILVSGLKIDAEDRQMLAALYPNATLVPMYATSFTGAAFPAPATDTTSYYPMAPVTLFDVIDPETEVSVGFGTRGRVVIHRLGEDLFWPNQHERETAIRVSPSDKSAIDWSGIAEVEPL